MSETWYRRHGRPLARATGWTVGVAVIALAALVALAQLLLPLLARHPQWVASELGERLQRPVSFASMQGQWKPAGPLLVLHDIRIGGGDGGQPLELHRAELKLDFGGWLLPSRHLLNLRVRGLRLDVSRDRAGRWHVNGVGASGAERSHPFSPGPLSLGVQLTDLHVHIEDTASGGQYRLIADQARLSREGGQIKFGALLRREGAAGRWRSAGNFRVDGSAGRLWLSGSGADLPALLGDVPLGAFRARGGSGDLSLWLHWNRGVIDHASARLQLAGLALARTDGTIVEAGNLRGLASIARRDDGFEFRWLADDGGALAMTLHQPGAQMHVGVAARNLQLAPLLPWLALKPGLAPALAQWLGSGQPRGVVRQASVQWNRAAGLQHAALAFEGLRIDPVGKLPGVSGLRGELLGDARGLSLQLPAQATTIQAPRSFRQPVALTRLAGVFAAWRADGAWHLGADPLQFAASDFAGHARGEVVLDPAGGKPFVDLYARVDHAQVTAAKGLLPRGMSPIAMGWLDRALVAGQVDAGSLVLRGNLADWPFRHHEGRFEAHAALSGLVLDYGTGWPRAEGLAVQATFLDDGLLAQASAGQSLGVKLEHAVAVIPTLGDGLLDLHAQGQGSGGSLLDFVRHSPVAADQAATLAKLKLGGKGDFDFHLVLPLHAPSQLQIAGSVQLANADLAAPAWDLVLDKLSGPLAFDAHGLHAGPLSGGFRGEPSTLELAIADATGEPDEPLWAQLTGRYTFAELVQGHPALAWLGTASSGRSPFQVRLDLRHAGAGGALVDTLRIGSPLTGMALALPVPLAKPAAIELPLQLSMSLPLAGSQLELQLGDLLRARLQLPADDAQPIAGTIALGSHMPTALPAKGLRIRGHAARLDATGWLQRAVAGSGDGGPGLESIDVSADRASVFGQTFADLRVQASPSPDALGIDVLGPGMQGHFSVPTTDLRKRGITARLQRLYWPRSKPVADQKPKAPPPAAASSSVPTARPGTAHPVAAEDAAATGIDPAALPPLHLWVADLRLGEARLGEARLETWPTDKGMHIDQLRALSPKVQITAGGNWEGDAQDSHTHLRIDFAAEDVGSLLGALGFEGVFEGGKTHAQLDASWPGAPTALALASMDGTLSIQVTHGHIPEVAAGVGRLFGLVSVAELPRRLSLDFGDVFGKGLAFDAITGHFRLVDGNATTDDLKIEGPAAEISITGRTGLRAHDYDQQVRVVPHLGGSLPVVGAVVAGPVGAAAGFAVQGLLGKGLNRAASARYRVTGTWDKPVFTLLEKHGPPPAAAKPAGAASGPAPAQPVPVQPASSQPAVAGSRSAPVRPAVASSAQRP